MPENLFASAFVEIRPEPASLKSFASTVRTTLTKDLAKKPLTVPVAPQLKPFKQAIQKQLSATAFTIPVTPVIRTPSAVRRQLQGQLLTATGGALTIPVTPVGVGAAGGAAGAAAAGGLGLSQAELAKTGVSAGEGQAILNRALAQNAALLPPLIPLTDRLGKAQGRAGRGARDAATGTTKLTAVERALESSQQLRIGTQARLGDITAKGLPAEEELVRVTALRNDLIAQSEKLLVGEAVNRQNISTEIGAQIAAERGYITALTDEIATRQRNLEIGIATVATNEAEVAAKNALSAVTTAGAGASTALAAATAREAAAKEAVSAADAYLSAAQKTLNPLLIAEAVAHREVAVAAYDSAASKLADAAAANKDAAASAKLRTQQELLGRGFLATALAALGARGATLAASYSFLFGAAGAVALFKSVQSAAQLEEELNVFAVSAGATADELERVSEKAKQLGRDASLPAVSANDAAAAMTELAKAGLSVQDSMDAARGTLQLATAAQLEVGEAVNITASALNAFGLSGTAATHVADLLAGAANEAQGGIGDMGGALSSVASVARQAGVTLEDTVALLTLLAKNGIQGQEAGTALRVALIRLIAPTDRAAKVLERLNISVLDAQGQVRPEVFADLAAATNELAPAQRNMALSTIFGTRAIRAQAVIGREGLQGLNDMREATNQLGLVDQLATARTKGLTGSIESLKNTASTTGLAFGEILIPAVNELAKAVELDIKAIGFFIDALGELDDAIDRLGRWGAQPFGERAVEEADKSLLDYTHSFGRYMDRVTAGIPVVGRFWDPLSGETEEARRQLETLQPVMDGITGDAFALGIALRKAIREFQPEGDQPFTPVSGAIEFVRELQNNITDTTPHAEELRNQLEAVERALVALNRAPTAIELEVLFRTGSIPQKVSEFQNELDKVPPLEFDLTIPERKAKEEARKSAAAAANVFELTTGQILDAASAQAFGFNWYFNVGLGAKRGAEEAARSAARTFSLTTQLALAEAAGDEARTLAILREQLAKAEDQLAKKKRRFKRGDISEEAVERQADVVTDLKNRIKSIEESRAAEAEQAADDIVKARNEADQKFLDALAGDERKFQNAVLRAEGSATLRDDIRTHTALRDFYVRSRDEARRTLKDAQTRAEAVADYTEDIIREEQELDDLMRELQDALRDKFELKLELLTRTGTLGQIKRHFQRRLKDLQEAYEEAKKGTDVARRIRLEILEAQEDLRDIVSEGFELDIEFAETTENERAEVRARRRYINYLKGRQAHVKRGTLEWKRLRNLIAEQEQAIKETQQAERDLFHEMSFEFLTRQQGFAANLLSNLLPGGVSAATVYGGAAGPNIGTTPGTGTSAVTTSKLPAGILRGDTGGPPLDPRAQRARDAALRGGGAAPSPGQVSGMERGGTPAQYATIIHLLSQIVRLLGGQAKQAKHPEAKNAAAAGGGAFDMM